MGLYTAQKIAPSTSQESLDNQVGPPRDTGETDVTLEPVSELSALI